MRLQLTPTRAVVASGLCLAALAPAARAATPFDDDPNAEVTMQLFTDSDHVSVRSQIGNCALRLPRDGTLSLQWNHERVRIPGVSAPVGSAEAVDAITTASRPISGNAYQDFMKVRNEMTVDAAGERVSAGYYRSEESDYTGQQLSGSWNRDMSGDLFNVAVGASYGWDAIRPVADDDTNTDGDTKKTVHWHVVGTRVLAPTTQVRVGVEVNFVDGLQHNPYRNVYAGGTNVPERHPDARQRRDAFLRLHQALPNKGGVRVGYRFYDDDWGIVSHEMSGRIDQYVSPSVRASYEYRFYTQGAADFQRDEYATTEGVDGYLTGDYRLGSLNSHLFGLALHLDGAAMDTASPVIGRMGLSVRWERYHNDNNYSANFLTTQLGYRF